MDRWCTLQCWRRGCISGSCALIFEFVSWERTTRASARCLFVAGIEVSCAVRIVFFKVDRVPELDDDASLIGSLSILSEAINWAPHRFLGRLRSRFVDEPENQLPTPEESFINVNDILSTAEHSPPARVGKQCCYLWNPGLMHAYHRNFIYVCDHNNNKGKFYKTIRYPIPPTHSKSPQKMPASHEILRTKNNF